MIAAEQIGHAAACECERRVYSATLALPARDATAAEFADWATECHAARAEWRERAEAAWEDFEAYRRAARS